MPDALWFMFGVTFGAWLFLAADLLTDWWLARIETCPNPPGEETP